MLIYELFFDDDCVMKIKYFPEQGEKFGIVEIDKKEGKIKNIIAPNDPYGHYALKIVQKILSVKGEISIKDKGIIAWY